MVTTAARRIFIENISEFIPGEVRLRGWVHRLRILGKTAFVILRDCSGEAQCVIASDSLKDHKLKVEDVVEILGSVGWNRARRPAVRWTSGRFVC
jgi:nondiscriminating aspartyl-tRNA synthetase